MNRPATLLAALVAAASTLNTGPAAASPLEGVALSGDIDFKTLEDCKAAAKILANSPGVEGGFIECTKYELADGGEKPGPEGQSSAPFALTPGPGDHPTPEEVKAELRDESI